MPKTSKMKGGVELKPSWNDRTKTDALTYFLENSMFRILTNNSISCITLIAKLKDGFDTPFISIDSLNFARDITSILIKVIPSNEIILRQGYNTDWAVIDNRPGYNGIEINSFTTIKREIETQKEIYRKSIISSHSFLDASCPAIIETMNPVSEVYDIKKIFSMKNIIPRDQKPKLTEFVTIQTILNAKNSANNQPVNISLIFMEFMEGYNVLGNLLKHPRYNTFVQFALYEIHRLHLFGYFHGDSHFGNIMVNPDIQHYTTTYEPRHLGIIKLIDFGRTIELPNQSKKDLLVYPTYKFDLLLNERLFQLYFGLSKDAKLIDVNPLIIESIRDSITVFNTKRKEFILKIIQPRLQPFYEFSSISQIERNPPNLLHALFPLYYGPYGPESYGGGNEYDERLRYHRVLDGGLKNINNPTNDLNITMSEPLYNTKMDIDRNEEYEPFKNYDWDEGREIVGNTLSETEKKMTLDDFKRIFSSALTQNDETPFDIPLFLKENLIQSKSDINGGRKNKIMKKSNLNKTKRTKKSKISRKKKRHTKRNSRQNYKKRK